MNKPTSLTERLKQNKPISAQQDEQNHSHVQDDRQGNIYNHIVGVMIVCTVAMYIMYAIGIHTEYALPIIAQGIIYTIVFIATTICVGKSYRGFRDINLLVMISFPFSVLYIINLIYDKLN